ncbi:hypothetical protein QFZ27_002177 [Inquilinus ginsengisoli]|uniref:M15 family metallopeptidase n=1 Tax=Inquilinus ginsengisoli TaxID=363840 RepID=UPI003D19F929
MAFLLSRGGDNVAAEVQRWQYFLLRRGITQVGRVDADFGSKTEEATKIFQLQAQLPINGELDSTTLAVAKNYGYTILNSSYYSSKNSQSWPPPPTGLSSPSSAWRNTKFGCFKFSQKAVQFRDRVERIVIHGNCDGTVNDWPHANIIDLPSTAFSHADGFRGYFRIHRQAKEPLEELLLQWKNADLLHLVISFAGAFDPRYIFGHNPGDGPQPVKKSSNASKLSNHAFGSAFDVNATQNWIGDVPAICGDKGAVRELVAAANAAGFYWGGHFGGGRIDGMHFELAQ